MRFEDSALSNDVLTYEVDSLKLSGSSFPTLGLKDNVTVPGWTLNGFAAAVDISNYNTTNFLAAYGVSTFSRMNFGITITRGAGNLGLKIFPAIFFTLFTGLLLMLLVLDEIGTRLQSIAGILLGLISLDLVYVTIVPSGNYLTLLDWIFDLSYFLVLGVIVDSVAIRHYHFVLLEKVEQIQSEVDIMKFHDRTDVIPLSKFLIKKRGATKSKFLSRFSSFFLGAEELDKMQRNSSDQLGIHHEPPKEENNQSETPKEGNEAEMKKEIEIKKEENLEFPGTESKQEIQEEKMEENRGSEIKITHNEKGEELMIVSEQLVKLKQKMKRNQDRQEGRLQKIEKIIFVSFTVAFFLIVLVLSLGYGLTDTTDKL